MMPLSTKASRRQQQPEPSYAYECLLCIHTDYCRSAMANGESGCLLLRLLTSDYSLMATILKSRVKTAKRPNKAHPQRNNIVALVLIVTWMMSRVKLKEKKYCMLYLSERWLMASMAYLWCALRISENFPPLARPPSHAGLSKKTASNAMMKPDPQQRCMAN